MIRLKKNIDIIPVSIINTLIYNDSWLDLFERDQECRVWWQWHPAPLNHPLAYWGPLSCSKVIGWLATSYKDCTYFVHVLAITSKISVSVSPDLNHYTEVHIDLLMLMLRLMLICWFWCWWRHPNKGDTAHRALNIYATCFPWYTLSFQCVLWSPW